jgi:DNA topoisomerase IB
MLPQVHRQVRDPAGMRLVVDPQGHIQAIGTDAAGRRQYRYHDLWREQQDQDKHDRSGPSGLPCRASARSSAGGDYTAKDFRTWHATVLAAVGLAVSESAAGHEAARKRAIARVVREVAGYLGNTPAVARASYIDPRVIELYEKGRTIASVLGDLGKNRDFGDLVTRGRAESAVVKLLARHTR